MPRTRPLAGSSTIAAGSRSAARLPDGKTFHGESFAHRTYFHGGERELTTEHPDLARPIDAAQSLARLRKPLVRGRNRAAAKAHGDLLGPRFATASQIVGVLGMSIEITAFEALRLDSAQQRVALLIDSRPDWKDDRGLVLFHGGQTTPQQKLRTPNEQWPVVDGTALENMLAPRAGDQVASGVLNDFHDPEVLGTPPTIAGLAPVWVRGDDKCPASGALGGCLRNAVRLRRLLSHPRLVQQSAHRQARPRFRQRCLDLWILGNLRSPPLAAAFPQCPRPPAH